MDVLNKLLRCLLLVLTAILGDNLVLLNQHNDLLKAICDNATHAAIGVITWMNVHFNLTWTTRSADNMPAHSILCGLISAAIDIDHFISARSLHLKDATSLSKRPPLHCTTFPLIMSCLFILAAHHFHSVNLRTFGWVILASFLSHHIRDAARRGIWLWPFGSTPPLGQTLYLLLTAILPFVISAAIFYTKESTSRLRVDSESISVV